MRTLGLSHVSAGFVAVLVGYSSSAAIIFQAASAAGASPVEISSWLWALGVGTGISTIGLSLYYRMPILIAWSTPGAALLVTALAGVSLSEATGVFLFSSGLMVLTGITGCFDRLMKRVPPSLAAALLAGVLLPFGLQLLTALEAQWLLTGGMILTFFVARQWFPRFVIPLVLLIGCLLSLIQGSFALTGQEANEWSLSPTFPVWSEPEFSVSTLIGIGVPLFVVTMSSQNMPGLVALRAHGYDVPASPLITWTGLAGLVLAPLGGFAFNLAAITAAICMGKEVGESSEHRYLATVCAGFFYLLTGLSGAAVVAVFALFPEALIITVAALALSGTIAQSLVSALGEEQTRDPAILTFLVTASGGSLLGVGSAFWGLVVGLMAFYWRPAVGSLTGLFQGAFFGPADHGSEEGSTSQRD